MTGTALRKFVAPGARHTDFPVRPIKYYKSPGSAELDNEYVCRTIGRFTLANGPLFKWQSNVVRNAQSVRLTIGGVRRFPSWDGVYSTRLSPHDESGLELMA